MWDGAWEDVMVEECAFHGTRALARRLSVPEGKAVHIERGVGLGRVSMCHGVGIGDKRPLQGIGQLRLFDR